MVVYDGSCCVPREWWPGYVETKPLSSLTAMVIWFQCWPASDIDISTVEVTINRPCGAHTRSHTFTRAPTDLISADRNASPLEVLGKPNLFQVNQASRSTPWRVQ